MKTVKVWDIAIRIFHWSLVAAFVTAYLSEDELGLHVNAGYVVTGLVLFRVIWGFVGSHYARFSEFVRSPVSVISYLRSLRSKHPQHYLGHNPAGGWMIIALLVALTATCVSGMKLYAIEEGKGPLANTQTQTLIPSAEAHEAGEHANGPEAAGEKTWEEIHEAAVNITLGLIVLHIAGVIISSRLHRESLVKAMITGNKNTEE